MKIQRLVLTTILILLVLTLFPVAAQGNVYYVAPDGDDGAPGTADEPWATLQHGARDADGQVRVPAGGDAGVLTLSSLAEVCRIVAHIS
jgi:hypothetical protein